MSKVAELTASLRNSSTSESEHDEASTKSKNPRGSNKHYFMIGTFDSQQLVEKEIKENHNEYTSHYKKKTLEGFKHFFRCRHSLYKGPQCATGLYYLMPADNLKFILYKTNCIIFLENFTKYLIWLFTFIIFLTL